MCHSLILHVGVPPRPSSLLSSDMEFSVRQPGRIQIQQSKKRTCASSLSGAADALPEEVSSCAPSEDGGVAGAPPGQMEMGAPKGVTAAPQVDVKRRRLKSKQTVSSKDHVR